MRDIRWTDLSELWHLMFFFFYFFPLLYCLRSCATIYGEIKVFKQLVYFPVPNFLLTRDVSMSGLQRLSDGYDFYTASQKITPFYSAPQCSHCKRCTSYDNSVRPSVRLSVTRRYCVKTTARSTVQFALSDSKICLAL